MGLGGVEVDVNFWDNALPIMDKKAIKRADVARTTGKTKSAVSDWIKRKVYPAADDALKIADLLGVSLRYLIEGKDDRDLTAREKELLAICVPLSTEKFNVVLESARVMRKETDRELSGGSSSGGLEGIKGN